MENGDTLARIEPWGGRRNCGSVPIFDIESIIGPKDDSPNL